MSTNKDTSDLTTQIKSAVEGLVYISETDSPMELFILPAARQKTRENKISHFKISLGRPIEELSVEPFFARLVIDREWHTEQQRQDVKKFRHLKALLEANLRDLRVFKVGHIRIDIYVVGIDPNGEIMGIRTNAVET